MILGTFEAYDIGTTHVGKYRLTQTEDVIITVYILREATYDEWMQYRESVGRPLVIEGDRYAFYYEVSTD